MKGKLIVLEGLSAAGKKTQTLLLVRGLRKAGKKVVSFSFPDYDSPVGKLIAEYLSGNWGKKEDLIHSAVLLYALDRYRNAPKIRAALTKNDFVILDRYSPSNLAFQGVMVPKRLRKKLITWIDQVESNLPKPDAVIILDVPRMVTRSLYLSRGQKNPLTKYDIHEKDAQFEEAVHQNYLELAHARHWNVVSCMADKNLLTPKEIHRRVLNALGFKEYDQTTEKRGKNGSAR